MLVNVFSPASESWARLLSGDHTHAPLPLPMLLVLGPFLLFVQRHFVYIGWMSKIYHILDVTDKV